MDFDLSEQEKMIQRAAREFAQRAVLPQAMEQGAVEIWNPLAR